MSEIFISELVADGTIDRDTASRMTMAALKLSEADVTTFAVNAEGERRQVRRIPLVDIGYIDADSAHAAVDAATDK